MHVLSKITKFMYIKSKSLLNKPFTVSQFSYFLYLFWFLFLFLLYFFISISLSMLGAEGLSFLEPQTWDLISNCLKNKTFLIAFKQTVKILKKSGIKTYEYDFMKKLMRNNPYVNNFIGFYTLVMRVRWCTNQEKNGLTNELFFVL